jgi:hypothetical protein
MCVPQGAGEARLLNSGAVELLEGVWGNAALKVAQEYLGVETVKATGCSRFGEDN